MAGLPSRMPMVLEPSRYSTPTLYTSAPSTPQLFPVTLLEFCTVTAPPRVVGVKGAVGGQGAVADGDPAAGVEDAPAEAGSVAGEGAVADRHRPAAVPNAAALVQRRVAGDGAAADRQRSATVADA